MLCLLSGKEEEQCKTLTTRRAEREGMPKLPSSGLPHQQGMMSGSKQEEIQRKNPLKKGSWGHHSLVNSIDSIQHVLYVHIRTVRKGRQRKILPANAHTYVCTRYVCMSVSIDKSTVHRALHCMQSYSTSWRKKS